MNEIYVSTDGEFDGPIPGPHSMLAFGSAAFNRRGVLVDVSPRTSQSFLALRCIPGRAGSGTGTPKPGRRAAGIRSHPRT